MRPKKCPDFGENALIRKYLQIIDKVQKLKKTFPKKNLKIQLEIDKSEKKDFFFFFFFFENEKSNIRCSDARLT